MDSSRAAPSCPRKTYERPRPGWSGTTAGWRRRENDHAVEPVLSKADGRPRAAGNCGTGTGQPAIGSADRQATRFGEAEPDSIGRAGGHERAKDFGNGKLAPKFADCDIDTRSS